jgi:hypothetical protein
LKIKLSRLFFKSPLDVELGLTGDGVSMTVQSYAARIATKVGYAQTVLLLSLFLHRSPARESIEDPVLGTGSPYGGPV